MSTAAVQNAEEYVIALQPCKPQLLQQLLQDGSNLASAAQIMCFDLLGLVSLCRENERYVLVTVVRILGMQLV